MDSRSRSPCDQVRKNILYWESLENSDFAVSLIKRGLVIPFIDNIKVQKACRVDIKERKTSFHKMSLLSKEIKELLDMDVIERVLKGTKVYENYIFCIKKPSGKLRVIFDMKQLNKDIKLPKLKMFKFSMAYQELLKNNFACKIDLSNAFWHLGIHLNYRRFLAFKFRNVIYQWKAMPFGLKTAPYLFCKFMSTFVYNIKLKFNIVLFFYMDDLFIVGPSAEITQLQVNIVINELELAGFTVNKLKSQTIPTQVIVFLGVEINLIEKLLRPSEENIVSCIEKVKKFCSRVSCDLKCFQSLVGSLNFVASYVKFGRLMLAPIFRFMRYFSNERLKLIPMQLKGSLAWWALADNFSCLNIPNFNLPLIKIYTDASLGGWGAHVIWADQSNEFFQGYWSESELDCHINIKELMACWRVLSKFPEKFSKHLIRVFSDNKSTVHWLKKETSTRSDKARDIIKALLTLKYGFNLLWVSVYLRGRDNIVADSLSRSLEYNSEIALSPLCFSKLCELVECTPVIDLFASSGNSKCKDFFSASPTSEALGVDAFSHSWDPFSCVYAFPPAHLVNRVIYKFLSSNCNNMLLIFPRSSVHALNNVMRLRAKIIGFQFSREDLIAPRNMTSLAKSQLDLIVCWF